MPTKKEPANRPPSLLKRYHDAGLCGKPGDAEDEGKVRCTMSLNHDGNIHRAFGKSGYMVAFTADGGLI